MLSQAAPEVVAAERGADVEAFHLADLVIDAAEGDAAGGILIIPRYQDLLVERIERGQLVIEVLEREIDAEGRCVLGDERADDREVVRGRDGDHTSNSPRNTVTAWPASFTRSPSRRTRIAPPRGEAW